MMAGFGHGTRAHPRSRSRTWSRWGSPLVERSRELGGGPDSATLGIIGTICAIAGFFVLGIVLGPVAVVCGWLAMGRSWAGANRSVPALIALVLGAIDTLLAVIALAGAATWGNGML
ncbi:MULTISPECIES: small hydrophobic protein [Streptomyces]|uniref:small hydrophobic protein n=2 Tax=Streptomyces TaxID=1883 RepID=UPI0009980745|nr:MULTISPECIES: small hydrophobic protein [Streptomyces]MBY8869067.1 small hydrophobic protein [Streptomyces sennicomposti]MYX30845.1 small hydrophobic protein [Streptomyces sp. SID8381]NMO32957.1 small hydrophobic protein [Streptomyces sp. GMY02]